MKRAVIAIAAAVTFALGLSSVANAQKPDKKAEAAAAATVARAPALIATAKVSCTPTGALNHGSFNRTDNGVKVNFEAIEVTCSQGLGYLLMADEKNGPVKAYDCIAQTGSRAANPQALGCDMPDNAHPEKGLKPLLTQASSTCEPTNARAVGMTSSGTVIYEVACTGGLGVLLVSPAPGSPEKLQIQSCFAAGSKSPCTLTTPAQLDAAAKALVAKADPKCTFEKQRYVMTTAEGEVLEVACTGGSGLMLVTKGGLEVVSTVPCARAGGYSGGCQLSDVKAAQTAEAGNYTQFARKAGFDCDVSQYGVFPTSGGGKEIVELACKNRPDGAVAIFSGDGKDQILNCNRAAIEGYRCTYSKAEATYAQINDQLKAAGKGSCVANASRGIGVNAKSAFLEVACADGNPGWVMVYPRGIADPSDIMSCGAAKASGVGACDLPSNKKAAIG